MHMKGERGKVADEIITDDAMNMLFAWFFSLLLYLEFTARLETLKFIERRHGRQADVSRFTKSNYLHEQEHDESASAYTHDVYLSMLWLLLSLNSTYRKDAESLSNNKSVSAPGAFPTQKHII